MLFEYFIKMKWVTFLQFGQILGAFGCHLLMRIIILGRRASLLLYRSAHTQSQHVHISSDSVNGKAVRHLIFNHRCEGYGPSIKDFGMFIYGLMSMLVGSLLIYLRSPHQKLLPRPLQQPCWYWLAAAILLVGFFLLMRQFGATAGFFCALTLLMLIFGALPYMGLLLTPSGGTSERAN